MTYMRVTPPVSITSDKIVSSTADEIHAPAAYSAGTTYALGAIVSVAADFKIYESLASGNLGNTPNSTPLWWRILGPTEAAYSAGVIYGLGDTVSNGGRVYESLAAANEANALPVPPATQTVWWKDVGPTNRHAMFDFDRNSQTVTSSPQTVVVAPGERINTIGFTGMSGTTLVVSATSVFGGGLILGPITVNLITREVLDGYDYCFEPFSTRPSHVVFDVPPLSDIIVAATISSPTGNVKCGSMVMGRSVVIGKMKPRAKNVGKNLSTIARTVGGAATLTRRRNIPTTRQTLIAPKSWINKLLALKERLNGVPALYTGQDDAESPWFEMFLILGIYNIFDIEASGSVDVTVDVGLEEI
ncbi:MAG TPA: hypothetical protein VLK85_20045 [Ramlibacter sp.]|nr:hypothetical protein [Ramlibacter sp.]